MVRVNSRQQTPCRDRGMQVYAIVGASGRKVSTEIHLCRRRSLAWKEAIPRGRMPPLEQEGTTCPRDSSCRQRVNLEPRCLFGAGKSFSTKTQRDQPNSRSHEALEPWFVFSCFRKIT
ncbi:hypothetical protein B0T13DRAFT_478847 [Neurospora crassa]|nr:hypothetical protein B0T13DRAFT_478847 [Neurospora crassa]